LVDMFGMTRGAGAFVGLMAGYYAYIWMHDAIHHRRIPRGHWLRPCFDRHALHHGGVEANFGVITPFCQNLRRGLTMLTDPTKWREAMWAAASWLADRPPVYLAVVILVIAGFLSVAAIVGALLNH
jgi:hypothetical protein